METKRVKLTREQQISILPERVRGLLNIPSTSVFACVEEDELAAIAVVTLEISGYSKYCISYLKVFDGYNIDYLKNLLTYIEKLCTDLGNKMISVRLMDEFVNIISIHEMLEKLDYIALDLSGRNLMYYFQDIEDTAFYEKLDNTAALQKNVYSYNELKISQINDLSDKLKKSPRNTNFNKPDLVFARFFVVDDEVKGYVNIKEIAPGIIYIKDIYCDNDESTKYAVQAMIASVLIITREFMQEDAVIYIRCDSENIYKSFIYMLGEPEIDHVVFEYGKVL